MRVLIIGDRGGGGVLNYVRTLQACMPPEVVVKTINGEEFAGRNGHDIREWFQIRSICKRFKPDVVHFNVPVLFMALYVRLFTHAKIVCSWHMPTTARNPSRSNKCFFKVLGSKCYYLPVSSVTWAGLKRWLPNAEGEVFFNPYRVGKSGKLATADAGRTKGAEFVVGMVGRNADQKDWPSFHKIEEIIQKRLSDSLGPAILDGRKVKFLNAGEGGFCDGVSAIRQMDVFVMTSRHEELPTVVLECFALGTPICGFVPVGGVIDILGFSDGSVRKAFIHERDCRCLADIVIGLLSDENKRMQMICDGRRILDEHFAAEKLVPEQLTAIYQKVQRG